MVTPQNEICRVGSKIYNYLFQPEDRKSFRLIVKPNQEILLKCPIDSIYEDRLDVIKKKWQWIEKQREFFGEIKNYCNIQGGLSGSQFIYLGKTYKIIISSGDTDNVVLSKKLLTVETTKGIRDEAYNQIIIQKWIEKQTIKSF
ncbi:MAG: M48 family metallopeptidase [Thermales bacterium]|nr:M48 family metallopeptidase [Thermales bacterium]